MKCPRCNYENRPGAPTCNLCGDLLPKPGSEPPPPPKFRPPGDESFHERMGKTEIHPVVPRSGEPEEPEIHLGMLLPTFPEEAAAVALNYCLVCGSLDPVPLDKDVTVTMGRDRTNDFIFPVGMVSRRHAEIFWDGRSFVVRDLDSANGTTVNRVRVKTRSLQDGDVICVGPYEMQVRAYRGSLDELVSGGKDRDATKVVRKTDLMSKSTTFAGRIGEVRLDEILQMIDFNKKSGTLDIESGDKKGSFFFQDGQILHGEFHHTKGVVAVSRILQLKEGAFHFHADLPEVQRTVFEPTSRVLLNAMRRLDELKR